MIEKADRKKDGIYTSLSRPLLICINPNFPSLVGFDSQFIEISIEPFSCEAALGRWSRVEPFSLATIRKGFKFKKLERGLIKAVFLAQKTMDRM
jgi:hypothetical protein